MRLLPALLLVVLAGAWVLLLSHSVAADVLVFDKYETVSRVQGNKIHIEREMVLTNVARNPVIPGELHFKIYERDGKDRRNLQVSDFKAVNERGQELGTKIINRAEETDLSVTIWDPLLPGFSYTFRISYDLHFEPSGLLFYELRIPQEETTIPIKGVRQTVLLEPKYHVTYAPQTDVSKISGNVVVSWSGVNEQQVIEYSSIPLPRIGVRAVNVFWGVIIISLVGIFGFSVMRKKRETAGEPQQLYQFEQPPSGG
jgi:hypothetical protein